MAVIWKDMRPAPRTVTSKPGKHAVIHVRIACHVHSVTEYCG